MNYSHWPFLKCLIFNLVILNSNTAILPWFIISAFLLVLFPFILIHSLIGSLLSLLILSLIPFFFLELKIYVVIYNFFLICDTRLDIWSTEKDIMKKYIYPTPPHDAVWYSVNSKWSWTIVNSKFSPPILITKPRLKNPTCLTICP